MYNFIPQEALRLYPPTKRIYRAVPGEDCPAAADIEGLHHDYRIWGPDVMEFCPGRFLSLRNLTTEQKNAYMPFGSAPHMCPAGHGFGERIVASMVTVLLRSLGTRKTGVGIRFYDEHLDGVLKAPLPTGRVDMERWAIQLAS
jgi:cytochrome P450